LNRELGLSKGAAFYRKTAAELVQRFPEIAAPLRDGRLCLTVVCELAKVLAPENRDEVLPRFFRLSKEEARELVAELRPLERPPLREVVTAVRAPAAPPTPAPPKTVAAPDLGLPAISATFAALGFPANHLDAKVPAPVVNAPTSRQDRPAFAPLTAELRRMHLTVSKRFEGKVAAARDALSHVHPGASTEEVLEAALDLLLEQAAKRRGIVERPRKAARPAKPAHIPAAVKRAVWLRDGGRCQFRLSSGESCGSTHQLEYDHIEPLALGGASTVENTRLCCRPHNQIAARRVFGDALMDRFAPGSALSRIEDERGSSSAGPGAEVVSASPARAAPA
jgi:5-methylcytosine-specific restriction endonuclease McrA